MTGPIPPPPIPYEYDDATQTFRAVADVAQLPRAFEHLGSRAPVTRRSYTFSGLVLPLVLLGAALALLAIGASGNFYFEVRDIPLLGDLARIFRRTVILGGIVMLVGTAIGLAGGSMLVKALRKVVRHVSVRVDPTVSKTIGRSSLTRASAALAALTPAYASAPLEVTVTLAQTLSEKGEEDSSQVSEALVLRAPSGGSIELEARALTKWTFSQFKNTRTTTTKKWHVTTLGVRPPTVSPDLARRLAALDAAAFPSFPNTALSEVSVQAGTLRAVVRSREALSIEVIAAYANTLAAVMGFPAPPFRSPQTAAIVIPA